MVRTHALVAEKHAADDAAAEAEGEGGANHAAAETGSFLTRTHNEADDEGVDPISGHDDRLIVWIFGELFGGYYPHKDVVEPPADEPGAVMIQKQGNSKEGVGGSKWVVGLAAERGGRYSRGITKTFVCLPIAVNEPAGFLYCLSPPLSKCTTRRTRSSTRSTSTPAAGSWTTTLRWKFSARRASCAPSLPCTAERCKVCLLCLSFGPHVPMRLAVTS